MVKSIKEKYVLQLARQLRWRTPFLLRLVVVARRILGDADGLVQPRETFLSKSGRHVLIVLLIEPIHVASKHEQRELEVVRDNRPLVEVVPTTPT